jgi:hypothetical protein
MERVSTAWIALVSTIFLTHASAFTLNFVDNPSSHQSASGVTIPIYSRAELQTDGNSYPMTLTGSGILKRKFGPLNINVYLCTSYTDLPGGLSHENPLQSLTESKARALQITLVRKVTSDELVDEFRKSLQVNAVDPDQEAIKKIMDQLTDTLEAKQVFTLIGYRDGNQEKVEIAMPNKMLTSDGPTIADDIWKMWFGVPANDGVAALKDQLVGKPSKKDQQISFFGTIPPELLSF